MAASRNLRSAATRLLNLGEAEMAQAAEAEATQLEQQGTMSAAGSATSPNSVSPLPSPLGEMKSDAPTPTSPAPSSSPWAS